MHYTTKLHVVTRAKAVRGDNGASFYHQTKTFFKNTFNFITCSYG